MLPDPKLELGAVRFSGGIVLQQSDNLPPLLSRYGLARLAAILSVSLSTKLLENLPLLANAQHHSTLPDRNMPPMEADTAYQECLPSYELHIVNHSLSGKPAKFKVRRLRMLITQS